MKLGFVFSASLVSSSLIFSACASDNGDTNSKAAEIPAGASAAKNNNFGAWAPLTPQVIDYDGNSSLKCQEGSSTFLIYLKTGFEIDVKNVSIGANCDQLSDKVSFSCEFDGRAHALHIVIDDKVDKKGNLGVFQNENDCEGYAYALKKKM